MAQQAHRNINTILDMLSQQDRTFKQLVYDESDPTQGIEDNERSEQLHSDMDMWDHLITDMMQGPMDLVIMPEDIHDETEWQYAEVAQSFSHAETKRITRQEVMA